ncbi:MAG: hypothetical protein D6729_16025 [Deltaproteobacteria bacterium]|nr:MAG: hypothetical protein D6729_16025 [Deltaproteobacteria bacterium]
MGRTASFDVVRQAGPAAVARALLERVRARDDGTLRRIARSSHSERLASAPAGPPRGHRGPPPLWEHLFRAAVWLSLLGLGVWLFVRSRPRPGRVALYLLLFAAALAVRVALVPFGPLHTNGHGVAEIRGLLGLGSGVDEAYLYGAAWPSLMRWLRVETVDGLAWVTAFLAAASVVAAAWAAEVLWRSRLAAVFVGVGLGLHPAHVLLSRSETPWPLAGALLAVAVGAGAHALGAGSHRRAWGWLAVLAAALASELRVYTLLLPPVAAVVLWAARPARAERRPGDRRRWPVLLPGVVFLLAVAVHHVWTLMPMFEGTGERLSLLAPWDRVLLSLPADPHLAPVALLPAALLVPLARSGRSRRLALACLGAFLILGAATLAIAACRSDVIRYQTAPQILLLWAAAGLARAQARSTAAVLAPRALLLALAVSALPGLKAQRIPDLDRAGFLATLAGIERMEGPVTLRLPPRRMGTEGRVLYASAEFLARLRGLARGEGRCYVHLPPACWRFTQEEVAGGRVRAAPRYGGAPLRPECARLGPAPPPAPLLRHTPVPWRKREFHRVPAPKVWLGWAPCR